MATEEQGKIVKRAADLVFTAIEALSGAGIDQASFEVGGSKVQIILRGDESFVSFRFDARKKTPIELEDDEKLSGMTPTPAPSPVPIDHFDLG